MKDIQAAATFTHYSNPERNVNRSSVKYEVKEPSEE